MPFSTKCKVFNYPTKTKTKLKTHCISDIVIKEICAEVNQTVLIIMVWFKSLFSKYINASKFIPSLQCDTIGSK